MKPMTLKQKEMYDAIADSSATKGYAYLEYGYGKPWNERVLDALLSKGVIKVIDSGDGWVRVVLRKPIKVG